MQNERTFRLQEFVDPLFGSERYISFEPDWVEAMEEGSKWLIFRPHAPVTQIKFKNGTSCTIHGHWAQRITDGQNEARAAQP